MNRTSPALRLNAQQQEAVKHSGGPLLIIAGAGTGKTTVITERVKHLIGTGRAKPSEILALTFTERAAQEMEERIDQVLPMGYTQTWISTFHSFCERVLRQEVIHLGLSPDFRILSQAETYLFIKTHLFELKLKHFLPLGNPTKFIAGLLTHFNRLKDEDVNPEQYLDWVQKISAQNSNSGYETEQIEHFTELALAFERYEKIKQRENVMDFADLISYTSKLFRKHRLVLKKYQTQFKCILIDEFQDTNYTQNHLAILLAGDGRNITVVADDDQSIYRWRGAAVYNVLDFKKHFPDAKIVTLIQNYRSQQKILDQAYTLIRHNNPNRLEVKEGIDKKLKAQNKPLLPSKLPPIQLIFNERVEDEAEAVAQEITALMDRDKTGLQYKEIAILARANNHAEPFVRALSRHGIPHQFLGPGRLYQKPEIKDLIAYLKVLNNFNDDTAMYRVLVMPQLSINRRDVAALVNAAKQFNLSLFEVMEKAAANQANQLQLRMRDKSSHKITNLLKIIHHHLDLTPSEGSGQILYYFVKDIGWLQKMAAPQSEVEEHQALNVSKFFDKIKAYETQKKDARVKDCVEYLDFVIAAGESPLAAQVDWTTENAVNIITVHSAKGLEFSIIFMVNLVNDRFPSRDREDQIPIPEELAREPLPAGDIHEQEERRLFYVGMTRAKERLYLTGARFYGEAKRPKKLTPFVYEALGDNLSSYLFKEDKQAHPTLFDWKDQRKNKKPEVRKGVSPLRIDYLSYTQVNTFEICPLHYKLKYILKIPTLPASAISFGRTLHETLRQFYQALAKQPNLKDMDKLFKFLLDLYHKNWISEGYETKTHENERRAQGLGYLQRFFEKLFDPQVKVLGLEESFNFKIEDLKIGGKVDRVDELLDGSIEIIDYKTGQVPQEKFLRKDLQLSIYALAANQVPAVWQRDLDKIKLSYYYFEQGQKKTLTRTLRELEEAKEKLLEIKRQIETSDFTCSGNLICQQGCEYALFCNTEHEHAS